VNYTSIASTATIGLLVLSGLIVFSHSAHIAIAMWLLANGIIAVGALTIVVVHSRRLEVDTVPLREFFLHGLKSGLANLLSLLNYRADIYIVSLLASPAQLGLYAVAIAVAEGVTILTQIPAVVTASHLGRLATDAAADLAARCARNTIAFAAVVALALAVLAPLLVRALYGPAFAGSVPAIRIVLIGVMAYSGSEVIARFFVLNLGKPGLAAAVAGTSAGVCIVLSLWLVPWTGIAGAAAGSAAGYLAGEAVAIGLFIHITGLPVLSTLALCGADVLSYRDYASTTWKRVQAWNSGRGSRGAVR
jgi:O-antigen/teichoic acid export membrane protein